MLIKGQPMKYLPLSIKGRTYNNDKAIHARHFNKLTSKFKLNVQRIQAKKRCYLFNSFSTQVLLPIL